MAVWFVADGDGGNIGPFSETELRTMVLRAEISPEHFVWSEGMENWAVLREALPVPPPLPNRTNEPTPAEAPAISDNVSSNFFASHWQGKLPLPVSYWLACVAITMGITLLGHGLGLLSLPPRGASAAFVAFGFATIIITVWQVVGTWRSAGVRIAQGQRFWAWAARLAMASIVVQSVYALTHTLGPMMIESAAIAIGSDDTPPYKIRVIRDGTEIELSGGMPFGTASALEKVLNATPNAAILHLNSIGGRVGEGHDLHKLVKRRKLATYASADCMSACTIAFLAGDKRYLATGARLGFHSLSWGGVDSTLLPEINSELSATYRAHGASAEFTSRVSQTRADQMWFPDASELLKNKIITAVVNPGDFAVSGPLAQSEETLDKALTGIEAFALLKEYDQPTYRTLFASFQNGIRGGRSLNEVTAAANAEFAKILPVYLRQAPATELLAYWRTQIAYFVALQKQPTVCVQFLFPERRDSSYNAQKYLSVHEQKAELDALAMLVRGAITRPVPSQKPNADAAFATLAERLQPATIEVVSAPSNYFDEPQKVCQAFRNFFEGVLTLEPPQSTVILRSFAYDAAQ